MVLDCSRQVLIDRTRVRMCCLTDQRVLEKMAGVVASDEAQTVASLNTARGVVTKCEAKFAFFSAVNSEALH